MKNVALGRTGIVAPQNGFGALPVQPAQGGQQMIPEDFPAPGGIKGQLLAERPQGGGGQLRAQAFRQDGEHRGGDRVPGPGQLRDGFGNRFPGFAQQAFRLGPGSGIRPGKAGQQLLKPLGQGFVIIIGGMEQNIAFRPQGGQQVRLLRQMGALQQARGALPGDGGAPEGVKNILPDGADGGSKLSVPAMAAHTGSPGRAGS